MIAHDERGFALPGILIILALCTLWIMTQLQSIKLRQETARGEFLKSGTDAALIEQLRNEAVSPRHELSASCAQPETDVRAPLWPMRNDFASNADSITYFNGNSANVNIDSRAYSGGCAATGEYYYRVCLRASVDGEAIQNYRCGKYQIDTLGGRQLLSTEALP